MKTTVMIDNDLTTIILTPENEFEKKIIEGFDRYGYITNADVRFQSESIYGVKEKQKMLINITTSPEAVNP